MVLLERLKATLEQCLSEEQGGFREDRGTVQQILTLRLINEKYMDRRKPVYHCFVDYTKAFDTVWHDGLWAVLDSKRYLKNWLNYYETFIPSLSWQSGKTENWGNGSWRKLVVARETHCHR